MSASASRAWITSGRPVSRAAAVCRTKALLLDVARAVFVVVVEARLADRHNLGMARQFDQFLDHDIELARQRDVRMGADRAEDVVMGFGDGAKRVKIAQLGRDAEHQPDIGVTGARQHAVEIGLELGKIEVAVTVDEHR